MAIRASSSAWLRAGLETDGLFTTLVCAAMAIALLTDFALAGGKQRRGAHKGLTQL